MKLHIVGGGSIGLLIAASAAERGDDVTIHVRREEQAEALTLRGVTLIDERKNETYSVKATTSFHSNDDALFVIALTGPALFHMKDLLKRSIGDRPVLFIQNGVRHVDWARQSFPNAHFASVEHGAVRTADTIVEHRGHGQVMTVPSEHESFKRLFERHQTSRLAIRCVNDRTIDAILWRKAVINCAINPLTALLRIKNGELLTNRSAYDLMEKVYTEIITSIPNLKPIVQWDDIVNVCQRTATNESSMLKDVVAGRVTEADFIVLPILKRGAERNETMPTLQTCYTLLCAVDERGMM